MSRAPNGADDDIHTIHNDVIGAHNLVAAYVIGLFVSDVSLVLVSNDADILQNGKNLRHLLSLVCLTAFAKD